MMHAQSDFNARSHRSKNPQNTIRFIAAAFIASSVGLATTGITGCGGGGWPRDLKIAPEQMYQVDAATVNKSVSLPAERKFIVHDHRSEQNPGQDGSAKGDSEATKNGSAFCMADASNGGSASADFLLGHVFHSPAGRSADAVAHIELKIQQEQTVSAAADAGTRADYFCDVFVRDSNERVVRKIVLVAASTEDGPSSSNETAIFDIPFTLESNIAYYVVVAGRVTAKSTEGHDASAKITIDDMTMQVRFTPAAAKPKADEASAKTDENS